MLQFDGDSARMDFASVVDQSEQDTEESEDELGMWPLCNVFTLCILLCC